MVAAEAVIAAVAAVATTAAGADRMVAVATTDRMVAEATMAVEHTVVERTVGEDLNAAAPGPGRDRTADRLSLIHI